MCNLSGPIASSPPTRHPSLDIGVLRYVDEWLGLSACVFQWVDGWKRMHDGLNTHADLLASPHHDKSQSAGFIWDNKVLICLGAAFILNTADEVRSYIKGSACMHVRMLTGGLVRGHTNPNPV